MRIIIAGGPKTGKTQLAAKLVRQVGAQKPMCTDTLIKNHDWETISDRVSEWFDLSAPWVVEGVITPHALEKWFVRNPIGKPADVVLWLPEVRAPQTPRQASMTKGCFTVWQRVIPMLRAVECVISDDNWDGVK